MDPRISPSNLAVLRAEHGLDRPLLARYGAWLTSALRGQWGISLSYNLDVGSLLWPRMRNTLLLTLTATILAWLIAVPAGVWLAAAGRARSRSLGRGSLSLMLAMPDLLVVLILQYAAARSGLFRLGGMTSIDAPDANLWSAARDVAWRLTLPVTALVASTLPTLIMHSASAVAEALGSPFVKGARANGIPHGRLLYRHALPAAANPLISLFGLSVGALLSGSVLVENAMGWPGLGRLMLEATLERDTDMVTAVVTLSSAFLLAGSLVSDLLLYGADPRIRRG